MTFSGTIGLLNTKLVGWTERAILMLPNLIAALIFLVMFYFLGRISQRIMLRIVRKISDNAELNKVISRMVFFITFIIGGFIALGILNLSRVIIILLIVLGLTLLVLGFAFHGVAANFIAGIIFVTERPFKVGDIIETSKYFGTVKRVNIRSTLIQSANGQIVSIPNKWLFEHPLTNYSEIGKRRVELKLGVTYDQDLEKVAKVVNKVINSITYVDKERNIEVFYTKFGEKSVTFRIIFWIKFSKQIDFLFARSDAIMQLKKAFDENGITIV